MNTKIGQTNVPDLTFADVFAGCGGLSLGLSNAGWRGRFAVEKHPSAFGTLFTNLVDGGELGKRFEWPDWLPRSAISSGEFLKTYGETAKIMRGSLDLLAGGPPCQGFSMAGRRTQTDPRNSLTEDYIEIVKLLEPRLILIENVKGFTVPFKKAAQAPFDGIPYSQRVKESLEQVGYDVYSEVVDLSLFGVPQLRKRFILIGIKKGDRAIARLGSLSPIAMLNKYRRRFLAYKGLPSTQAISVYDAIGDLETHGKELALCTDSPFKAYHQVPYDALGHRSSFIELMRRGTKKAPNSLRLPRHAVETVAQFKLIMDTCPKGRNLSDQDRERLGVKKHALTPLSKTMPSVTVTSLPDDMVHYSEPRVLTARENARLQTFPDSFQFTGNYTTGGISRRHDCPRYTQIGNAVPPLFAEALGRVLKSLAL